MPHIFISYVRENQKAVDRICAELREHGLEVWLDREQIRPGQRWQSAIRSAIREGAYFLACFSAEYAQRARTYMNEELTVAIEELRLRPAERAWFIPIRLSGNEVPNRSIGGGESLRDIQWVDLTGEWHPEIYRLINELTGTQTEAEEIEVYGIDRLNRWPYESVTSVSIERRTDSLRLLSDLRKSTRYRCYDGRRDQCINWCLVPFNFHADTPEEEGYYDALSPSLLLQPRERWIQIEYVMFQSISAPDDSKLEFARNRVLSGKLDTDALPPLLRPDSVQIENCEDPHHEWFEEGKKIDTPCTTLFLSRLSDIPYINEHTIPKGRDYAFVTAFVFSYKPYRAIPNYADLLAKFRTYCHWFNRCLCGSVPTVSDVGVTATRRKPARDEERRKRRKVKSQ